VGVLDQGFFAPGFHCVDDRLCLSKVCCHHIHCGCVPFLYLFLWPLALARNKISKRIKKKKIKRIKNKRHVIWVKLLGVYHPLSTFYENAHPAVLTGPLLTPCPLTPSPDGDATHPPPAIRPCQLRSPAGTSSAFKNHPPAPPQPNHHLPLPSWTKSLRRPGTASS